MTSFLISTLQLVLKTAFQNDLNFKLRNSMTRVFYNNFRAADLNFTFRNPLTTFLLVGGNLNFIFILPEYKY